MRECDRFGKIFVQTQRPCNIAAELSDFQCMGDARPVMIAVACLPAIAFLFA